MNPLLEVSLEYQENCPKIGEIKRGSEIGKATSSARYIWLGCKWCGKERWVRLDSGKPRSLGCTCRKGYLRENSSNWKGGQWRKQSGYLLIKLYPADFFYPMTTKQGYVMEHRLVMAQHLNRCLLPWEVVHHKNGDKTDNRLENLQLLGSNAVHNKQLNKEIKQLQRQVKGLESKVEEQAKQIRLLQWQYKNKEEKECIPYWKQV